MRNGERERANPEDCQMVAGGGSGAENSGPRAQHIGGTPEGRKTADSLGPSVEGVRHSLWVRSCLRRLSGGNCFAPPPRSLLTSLRDLALAERRLERAGRARSKDCLLIVAPFG